MKIQSTIQIIETQPVSTNTKVSEEKKEFQIDISKEEEQYTKDELQYIKNASRLHANMFNGNIEESTKIIKTFIDNRNNENSPVGEGFFPTGSNLTDEFTDAMLKLPDEQFIATMILISEKNTPTLDDRRYYSHSGTFGTTSYQIAPKNDPKYPIGEYGKENFESNDTIAKMLQSMLDKLIEDSKLSSGDFSFILNTFETLISNFTDEITKSEDEKNTILKHITQNNKPNPLNSQG